MKRSCLLGCLFILFTTAARGQTLGTPGVGATPGTPVANAIVDGQGANWVQQVDISGAATSGQGVNAGNTQVNVQALNAYFSKHWRLYVSTSLKFDPESAAVSANSTTPTTPPATTLPGTTPTQPATPTQTAATSLKLTEPVIAGLVDPFGGLFNGTVGGYYQLRSANGAKDDYHGLFLDFRGGLRLLDLPGPSVNAVTFQGQQMTMFYTGMTALRLNLDLYLDSKAMKRVGGFETGGAFVFNSAFDTTQSGLFAAHLLDTTTAAATGWFVISITGNIAIQITMTPWTSNDQFPKRITFGVKLLNHAS
jgi:hypothetical protein